MAQGGLLQVEQNSGFTSSHAITFDTAPAEGSLIVGVIRQLASRTVTPPTGFTLAVSRFWSGGAGVWVYLYYKIAGASEGTTYEWTWTGGDNNTTLHVLEYEGPYDATPLGETASADSGGADVSSQSTGTTAETSQADKLAVGSVGNRTGGAQTSTSWTNSFTEDQYTGSASLILGTASLVLTATQTVETTHTISGGLDATGVVATFKFASAGTPGSATPAALSATLALPATTQVAPAVTTPAVLSAALTTPATTQVGSAVASPASTDTAYTIPGPTVAGGADVAVAATATPVTVPQVSAVAGGTIVEPGTVALSFTLPQATLDGPAVPEPATIGLSVVIPQAATTSGDLVGASPAAIDVALTLPLVTVETVGVVSPDATVTSITIPTVSVAGPATAEPQPATLTLTVPTVSLVGGAAATPATIPLTVSLPSTFEFEGVGVVHIPGNRNVDVDPSTTHLTIDPHLNQVVIDESATFVTVADTSTRA